MPSMAAKKGFVLLELALGILLIALLGSGFLLPLDSLNEQRKRIRATQQIADIKLALQGYFAAHQRFPCPHIANTQDPKSCTTNVPSDVLVYGFVPYSALGIEGKVNGNNLLLDPWGNPYRYAVQDDVGEASSQLLAGGSNPNWSKKGLYLCRQEPSNIGKTQSNCGGSGSAFLMRVPLLLFSMGGNWRQPATVSEQENIDGDDIFMLREYGSRGLAEEHGYDDMFGWLSYPVLYRQALSSHR